MNRNFTDTTGFQTTQALSTESINSVESPFNLNQYFTGNRYCTTDRRRLIKRACDAYEIDGFIRIAVDRHAEMFTDFEFNGGATQVAYLKRRLNFISLRSGEHWKTILSRYVHEYFKHGNPFLAKVRGDVQDTEGVKRPLYKQRNRPISSFFLVSPTELEAEVKNGKFLGWKYGNKNDQPSLVSGTIALPPTRSLLSIKSVSGLYANGADLVHTPYKKASFSTWGFGITFSALDDVNLLRNVEQITAEGLKKNTIPLLWHKITKADNPLVDPRMELEKAAQKHRTIGPDNVIVTPGTHELKVLGSESQSLRTEGYLNYYARRVFSGLGTSPFLMGFETGTLGTVEAAIEMLMNRIRFCQQELAINFEMFLINELLWEGGFDPYMKEEDQVKIVFKDMDEARVIKLQAHYSDLFNKNFIGLDEGRKLSGIKTPLTESDMYIKRIQIPLAEKKAAAGADSTTVSASMSREKFFVENFGKVSMEQFVNNFVSIYGEQREDFEETCQLLSGDPDALLTFVTEVIE
jgi:hypothetical protein